MTEKVTTNSSGDVGSPAVKTVCGAKVLNLNKQREDGGA